MTEREFEPDHHPGGVDRRMFLKGGATFVAVGALTLAGGGTALAVGPWGGYSNGYIPNSAMTQLSWSPGRYLRSDAATALTQLNALYKPRFGGFNIYVTDAYRSYADQVRLKQDKPNLAATPGTSNHGWALAVDLGGGIQQFGSAQHQWMFQNAPAYGWVLPTWARSTGSKPEPWHWEYVRDVSASSTGDPEAGPNNNFEDDDVKNLILVRQKDSGMVYVANGMTRRHVTTSTELADIQYLIKVRGGDDTVQIVERIEAFGKII